MPLLSGRKNIGHNIEVEEAAGKPRKQAVAIALSKARGKDYSDAAQKPLYKAKVAWQERRFGDCIDAAHDAINAGADGEDLREARDYIQASKRMAAVKSKDSLTRVDNSGDEKLWNAANGNQRREWMDDAGYDESDARVLVLRKWSDVSRADRNQISKEMPPVSAPAKDVLRPVPMAKDRVLGRGAVGDDLMSQREEENLNKALRKNPKGIEAYGVKGFKNTQWRKVFKSAEAMEKWCEQNDAEVQGTRDVAQDSRLPVPVDDETKYAERPKPNRVITSVAAPTREDVERIYAKRDPEGMKKSFGKDAAPLRPVNVAPIPKFIPVSKRPAKDSSMSFVHRDMKAKDGKVWRVVVDSAGKVSILRPNGSDYKLRGGSRSEAEGVMRELGLTGGIPTLAKDALTPKWQPDSPDQAKLNGLHRELTAAGHKYDYSSGTGKGEITHVYKAPQGALTGAYIFERKNGNHGKGRAGDSLRQMAHDSFHGVVTRGPGESARANDAARRAYGKSEEQTRYDNIRHDYLMSKKDGSSPAFQAVLKEKMDRAEKELKGAKDVKLKPPCEYCENSPCTCKCPHGGNPETCKRCKKEGWGQPYAKDAVDERALKHYALMAMQTELARGKTAAENLLASVIRKRNLPVTSVATIKQLWADLRAKAHDTEGSLRPVAT